MTTVEALQPNREGLANLRRVLYGVGEHPPKNYFPKNCWISWSLGGVECPLWHLIQVKS